MLLLLLALSAAPPAPSAAPEIDLEKRWLVGAHVNVTTRGVGLLQLADTGASVGAFGGFRTFSDRDEESPTFRYDGDGPAEPRAHFQERTALVWEGRWRIYDFGPVTPVLGYAGAVTTSTSLDGLDPRTFGIMNAALVGVEIALPHHLSVDVTGRWEDNITYSTSFTGSAINGAYVFAASVVYVFP